MWTIIIFFAEELEGKVKSLANYERLQELQSSLVWPSITELDPKTYVPEVRNTGINTFLKTAFWSVQHLRESILQSLSHTSKESLKGKVTLERSKKVTAKLTYFKY